MRTLILLLFIIFNTVLYAQNTTIDTKDLINLSGRVTLDEKPVKGCFVLQENSLNETKTDEKGDFKITVPIGAILFFNTKDARPKEIVITDDSFILVKLISKVGTLDEVVLSGKKNRRKKIKDMSRKEARAMQKDRSGIGYQSVEEEDFLVGANMFLADLIRGRFLQVHVEGEGDRATYHSRAKMSIVLDVIIPFAVDGILFRDPPAFLNLNYIENITFKSTLAGTNKYGAAGRNGIIEITTTRPELIRLQEERNSLITDNDYKEITKELSSSQTFTKYPNATPENLEIIKKQFIATIEKDPYNISSYVDYYKVVVPVDAEVALSGLKRIVNIAENNSRVLRSLAFLLEEQNFFKEANNIYKRILVIAPNESQTYLDLAQSYIDVKDYRAAFEKLKTLLSPDTYVFKNTTESRAITDTEIKHLLTKFKDKVSYYEVPPSYYEQTVVVDKRILIEWNDPQMEFELQFVNPSKKFYDWSHSANSFKNEETSGVGEGLLSKEFIIDDDPNKGEWLINITNNLTAKSKIPAFLKMTIHTNYGGPNERKQVRVIPLSELNEKFTVHKIEM